MWSHLASQCEYFQKCLERNPHLALIVDEKASQGCEEVLSGYLCLFNFIADPSKPIKHRVLINMCNLPRMTGSAIAIAIRNSLQNIEAYNTITTKRLEKQTQFTSVVCEKFVALHPRRMTSSSLLADKGSNYLILFLLLCGVSRVSVLVKVCFLFNNTDSHISRLAANFIFQAFERRKKHISAFP